MTEHIMTETERELLSNHLAAGASLRAALDEARSWGLRGILDHAGGDESQPGEMKAWGLGRPAVTLGTPATTDTEDDAKADDGSAP